MTTFYLTGQMTFGNRGCEAIVRSTVAVLREVYSDVKVLVPSDNIELDTKQWLDAANYGVEFIPAYIPPHTRFWAHTQRLPLPFLKRAGWPFPFPDAVKQHIRSADALLSVGGDNYSLDYRLPSLLMGMDKLAMDLGKPVILWGASVGPFDQEPDFIPRIVQHLAGMSHIMVRESVSYTYLTEKLGLPNVSQMVDPAFILEPEAVDITHFWPSDSPLGVIGLNVSPLIEKYRQSGKSLIDEVEAFIRKVVAQGFSVLLVPHVMPLDDTSKNNDAAYMADVLQKCADLGGRVSMSPRHLNAVQSKDVIGQLRFFIGARTHATIAALSMGVPTISIAYSVKARGINQDLFDDDWMVLPTPLVSEEMLSASLEKLIVKEHDIKQTLETKMPEYRQKILDAITSVKQIVSKVQTLNQL